MFSWNLTHRRVRQPFAAWVISAVVVAFNITTGCALDRQGLNEVSALAERFARERPTMARNYVPAGMADQSEPRQAAEASPSGAPGGLEELIALALERNRDLKAAWEAARTKAHRIAQVTALPDPMLTTKWLPEAIRTAEGDNSFILALRQRFPLPEKLDRAGRIALQDLRMSLHRLAQTRLRVIGDVKRAYFRLYDVEKSAQITRENQDLLVGLIEVARAQVAAGKRPQEDVLRAQVERSILQTRLIDLNDQRVVVIATLNALLDRKSGSLVNTPSELGRRRIDEQIEELFTRAADANPQLARLRERMERDRHSVRLAELAYYPDFTLGFEWMLMEPRDAFTPPVNPLTGIRPRVPRLSEDGSDNWAVVVGFNLPIWHRKLDAGVREAKHRLAMTKEEYAGARNTVRFQIVDALAGVRAQQELAELLETTIIPQAEQTYRVSQSSYTTGTSDFLYVIDNWQKWLNFKMQYHRSLAEFERAVADLEQAVGLSIAQIGAGG